MLNKFVFDIISKTIVSEASSFCKEFPCQAQHKVVCLTTPPTACLFFPCEKRAIPAPSRKRKRLFLIILIMFIILNYLH